MRVLVTMRSLISGIMVSSVLEIVISLQGTNFLSDTICDINTRVGNNCSFQIKSFRSNLECYVLCARVPLCVGASLDSTGRCYHHTKCPAVAGCTLKETGHRFQTKECYNAGTWNVQNQKCVCSDQWDGQRCQHSKQPPHVTSCQDMFTMGFGGGDHLSMLDLGNPSFPPFQVVCGLNAQMNTTAIFVARNEGTQSFDKTWADYRDGFFFDTNNLWLGLKHWRALNNAGYGVLDIQLHWGSQYRIEQTYYIAFNVKDETQEFAYSFFQTGDISGVFKPSILQQNSFNFGDCFKPVRSSPFSTSDRDNDGDSGSNCAATDGSGWWFSNGCNSRPCNPLGWSWKLNNSKPAHQLIALSGIDMSKIGYQLERIDIFLSKT